MSRPPARVLPDALTSYNGVALRPTQYPTRRGAVLADDGIVDEVAIDRFRGGDNTVRLTPRELVCIVIDESQRGSNDGVIAAMFGHPGDTGRNWINHVRRDHRIPAPAAEPHDDNLDDLDLVDLDLDELVDYLEGDAA